ncbi:MAG: HIR complex subunit [Candelina submexicana]|nr:MAG: HIR complex subunit [Candelina submexicana]
MFFTKLVTLVITTASIGSLAAPQPKAIPELTERNNQCPRWNPGNQGAQAIAGLYLGNANNKSNQLERLIEQAIALTSGCQPQCDPQHIYVYCEEDGDHWGWNKPQPHQQSKRNDQQCDDYCNNKYPYKHCNVREKKDFEVYSCHVSPDGSRLVTAAGDGHVRVWSTEAIYRAADLNYAKPKQLASMSYHSGTIHTVRFSSNNRYLASGADDKIVCVYTLDPNPPSHSATFGTNEPPPVENWRIFRRLIGHDNDVQDLGWSYDSSILVSVGLDSKIVIWSGHTFEKLKTLSNHQSHVKGLTFDPANKHFATASDDRTVKIFRFSPPTPNSTAHDQMNNFTLETTIVAPFASSPLTTYFRRCSWSPDGNHIATANAVNGPVSSVAIINRGNWDSEINLIGHEAPVEVCAFNPRLFCKDPPNQANQDGKGFSVQHLVTVIAAAGQDKALSVWNTSVPRPLLIAQDVGVKSISDLAWAPDGMSLFATSLDGSVVAAVFEEGDLGYVVGMEENERALSKFGAGRRGAGIVEGPEGLLLEERSRAGELRGVEGRMGALMGDIASSSEQQVNGSGAATSANNTITNGTVPGAPSESANGLTNGSAIPDATGTAQAQPQAVQDPHAAKLERLKQRVTITKDGKKRIAPLLVSSAAGSADSSLPKPQMMAASASNQGAKSDAPQTILDLSSPFAGLPRGGLASLLLGNKRKIAAIDGDEDGLIEKRIAIASRNGTAVPILQNSVAGLVPAQGLVVPGGMLPTPDYIRPAVVSPNLVVSQVRLSVPKVRSHIVQGLNGSNLISKGTSVANNTSDTNVRSLAPNAEDTVLEARNPGPPINGRAADREATRIVATKRGQTVWQDFLPRSVLLVIGNQRLWCTGCEDASIYVWTPAGRRLLNALVLDSQPVILDCNGWWLLCITAAGMCYVWNIETLSSPHPPISLAPVLDAAVIGLQNQPTVGPAVTSARLNSQGKIIVTLTNGDGYTYNPAMFVWQRLSELWWAVGSQYWNTTDSSVGDIQGASDQTRAKKDGETLPANVSAGIIPFLERSTSSETLLRGRGYLLQKMVKTLLSREGYEGLESSVSVAHLENRVAAAMTLGAREEFRVYLYMYAKRLGAEGLRGKVEELLRSLLGGIFKDDKGGDDRDPPAPKEVKGVWEGDGEQICGWDRKELLKGVVLILGKQRDLQRVTVPYANLLGIMDNNAGDNEAMVS